MMEGCSLNDAFSMGEYASVNCTDRGAAEESRRQEKKKARKCRGPALKYLNGGMNMVGPVIPDTPLPSSPMNEATGLTEHAPVTQQYEYESFVGDMDNLADIRKNVKGQTKLQGGDAQTAPDTSFFGANPSDSEEGFVGSAAPFINVIGSDESYKLKPDFTTAFGNKGVNRANSGGLISGPSPVTKETEYLTPTSMLPNSILPVPNVDVFWKENGIAGGQSAFFSKLKAPGGLPVNAPSVQDAGEPSGMNQREILTKLDKIFARLDDIESTKSENSQTEVLLFIMTGLGVIFLMDIGCRAAGGSLGKR